MVELGDITKSYADRPRALKGVSLRLDEGMFGLLGHNGAGKTTLLSILVLGLEPTSGRRVYDGVDASPARARAAIRRRIGFLPQDFHPIGHLTGREYLLHCARLRELPLGRSALRRRVAELLEAVSLERAADRRAGEYSGGMKRRLGIAQALIHSPPAGGGGQAPARVAPGGGIRLRQL